MSRTQTITSAPLHSFEQGHFDDQQLDEDDQDLGVGTSTGPAYRGLPGSRPLTIASLLDPGVRFVKQKQAAQLNEIPYTPINAKPTPAGKALLASSQLDASALAPLASSATLSNGAATPTSLAPSTAPPTTRPGALFPTIDPAVGWAKPYRIGRGLQNEGNTCFLNSALQTLLHTPPLVRALEEIPHDHQSCGILAKKKFCMTCAMKMLVTKSFQPSGGPSYSPRIVTSNIRKIAQHLRAGRQEDAHEFLRFCVDGMVNSALFGTSPKLDQKLKESTFVHQIFGGRLRSRVLCTSCGHASDTFDSVLDISLDLPRNVESIRDALAQFVKVDQLRGSNKYKCEKCKKLVNADKNFTIHEAPMVLTIHLKRFTPMGRKITEPIKYPEVLALGPYMSDRAANPTYRLQGVICHSGGGPHSGHYTSFVKSSGGRWHSMNDESVQQTSENKAPLNSRNAYVLFYCREKGDALQAAIRQGTSTASLPNGVHVNGNGSLGGSGSKADKKRRRDSIDSTFVKNSPLLVNGHSSAAAADVASPLKKLNSGPRPPIVQSTTAPAPPPSASPRPPLPSTIAAPNFYGKTALSSPYDAPNVRHSGVFREKGSGSQRGKNNKLLKVSTVGKLGRKHQPKLLK